MSRPKRTRDHLARELRLVADKATPGNAAKYRALADRADTGEFDDFSNVHICGPTALHRELMAAGFTKFAARVETGEFDATKEESDEWAASEDGQAAMGTLPESMLGLFK